MTLEEIAKEINTTRTTLYHWKKSKPKLYEIIMKYYQKESKETEDETQELVKYFNELSKEEKEMYLAEIKARALRKKLK